MEQPSLDQTGQETYRNLFNKKKDYCQKCGNDKIITDYGLGEAVCAECGYVIKEVLVDMGPEWRAFSNEEKQTRVRATPTKSTLYTGTSFDIPWDDEPEKRAEWTRKKIQHNRSAIKTSYERNLKIATPEIDKITEKLNLTGHHKQKAHKIYLKALEKELIKGRSINEIVGASVYATVRSDEDIVRSFKEVAVAANLSKKDLAKNYSLLVRELHLKTEPDRAEHHISKISSKLGLDTRTEQLAAQILKENKNASGKNPIGLAAAALYIAAKYDTDVTQKEVSNAAEITEVTIRNRMKSNFGINVSGIKDFVEHFLENQEIEAYNYIHKNL